MLRLPAAPAVFVDGGAALAGMALTAVPVWVPAETIGTPVAGPFWFRLLFPLLLAGPLAWRRSAPLAALSVTMATVVAQALLTGDSPEGLELIFVVGLATYSAAAHTPRPRAVAGLAVVAAGYGVYAAENRDIRTGLPSELWAGSFFLVLLLAAWLLGVFLHSRREEQGLRERQSAREEAERRAAEDERARLARELHDVISHTLSVVVVQAAGARASGNAEPATLEKIENSGRESLTQMRRLLGVLRRDADASENVAELAPQPGTADLQALTERVGDAGLPVELVLAGDHRELSAALGLSIYRIVQEALTNALKHAGPAARAWVTVGCDPDRVTVEVLDDGAGIAHPAADLPAGSGHGLIGMRERVTLFGGRLEAGPRPEGGFAVRAWLPREPRPA